MFHTCLVYLLFAFKDTVKPVYNGHPWDPQKAAVVYRGGRYSEVSPIKLQLVWDVWGSGWPLLTGGRCSEVAVNTGLTVPGRLLYIILSPKCSTK